jgi:hypothetical protein
MKFYLIILIGFVVGFNASCDWYIFQKSKYSVTDRPEICNTVFDNPPVNEEKLKGYSVEELLILQKCGLAYYPEYQLQWDIADQDEYPVPAIIRHLQTDEDEHYQFYLISDLETLTRSEKHSKRLLSDKDLILTETSKAISKMQNEATKSISEARFIKIKEFFSNK